MTESHATRAYHTQYHLTDNFFRFWFRFIEPNQGYIEIIDVGAQIVGSIKSFGPDAERPGKTVDYRSHVKQGDVLAQLDDLPHQAELDKAKAYLKLAEAEVTIQRLEKTASGEFKLKALAGEPSGEL